MRHNEHMRGGLPVGKDGDGAGIDPALRDRVVEQIQIVTDALDAAVAKFTDAILEISREETDKLMRTLGRSN
jgi:hypothetical protein